MSDREPGVFYIIRRSEEVDIYTYPWWGFHTKLCIEYYRDYGETLVDTYCHDVTRNYTNEVGIEELGIRNYELGVFPNPTMGELRITNYELGIKDVEVFDVYGKRHASHVTNNGNESTIDISQLSAGIYFLRLTTEKGFITKKIIKK